MRLNFQIKLLLAAVFVVATTAQAVAPGWRGAILFLGALLGLALVFAQVLTGIAARQTKRHSAFDDAQRCEVGPSRRPADLEAFERSFGWGVYQEAEFRHHLRPVLEEIALGLSQAEGPSVLLPAESDRDEHAALKTEDIMKFVEEIERKR